MDEVGIVKSMVLTQSSGAAFDAIAKKYARYPDRFEVWCGFDYTDADQPGWEQRAVAELVRCHANGAKGMSKAGILDHDQLVATLEHAVRDNPGTRFIACHLANCNSDLGKLGRLFDAYPNLYADVAARYGEFSPIPRFAKPSWKNTPIGLCTVPIWATSRPCTASPSAFWNQPMSIFTSTGVSPTIGPSMVSTSTRPR